MKKFKFNFYINPEDHKALKKLAKAKDQNVAELARQAIKEYISAEVFKEKVSREV